MTPLRLAFALLATAVVVSVLKPETKPFKVLSVSDGEIVVQPYVAPLVGTKVVTGAVPSVGDVLNCTVETVSRVPNNFEHLVCGSVRLEINGILFGG